MVGATIAPFVIGPGTTQIAVKMHAPQGPRLPTEVTLVIENLTGDKRAPPFTVYLNLPDGDSPKNHPELQAGSLGLFGLVESRDPASGGNGLTFTLDVTSLFGRLMLMKQWDPRTLNVSFVPTAWDAPVPRVRVGRVSLYLR